MDTYELVLPRQLRSIVPDRPTRGAWRPHIDLALELKGQGREWAHLSEIGLRLGLPGQLFAGKPQIAVPTTSEEWQAMRRRVCMDCVLTAIVALSFWRVHGRIALDQAAFQHNIAEWCIRKCVVAEQHTTTLQAFKERFITRMTNDLNLC